MPDKFIWIDDADHVAASSRLAAIRSQLEEWDWFEWDEGSYKGQDDAFSSLCENLFTLPMMHPGKAIVCHGLPSCQAKLAAELDGIPDMVLLVLVARVDTRSMMYKKTKGMDWALVDEPLVLKNRDAAAKWATNRAASLGLEIDQMACKLMIDFVGTSPAALVNEMIKLGHLCDGKKIYPWAVEQACHGSGMTDVKNMCSYMSKGNYDAAHEYMSRLLGRGEPPLKICGYLMDWTRKMAIAGSGKGDYDAIKEAVARASKFKKPTGAELKKVESLRTKVCGAKSPKESKKARESLALVVKSASGSSVPMFPKPGALFYSCKDYNEINGDFDWPCWLLMYLGKMQLALRGSRQAGVPASEARIMHGFIEQFRKVTGDDDGGGEKQ